MYHERSVCHIYMRARLGHSHDLYVPAVSKVVTNGNGTVTKNDLKGTMGLVVFSAQTSVYGAVCYIDLDDLYH